MCVIDNTQLSYVFDMYSGFFKGEMLLLEIYFEKNTLLFCTEIYLKPFAVFGEKNLIE